MEYDEKLPKIPTAAVTIEDAEMLARMVFRIEFSEIILTFIPLQPLDSACEPVTLLLYLVRSWHHREGDSLHGLQD